MSNKRKTTVTPWQATDSPLVKPRKRRVYTEDEKLSVISRYLKGEEPLRMIISSAKVPKTTIYNWVRAYMKDKTPENQPTFTPQTVSRLRRKVSRSQDIISILQTVHCTAQSPLKKKLYEAEKLIEQYNIHVICEALNISRATFYNHLLRNKKNNTWYAKRREELCIRIKQIHDENHQIFGAGKIQAVLRREGIKTSEVLVRELMREMGLVCIRQDAKKLYAEERKKFKNIIKQNFDTDAPNQVWASDVTYFKFGNKQYFICVILDLYSRKAIAYKISQSNSTQLVKSTTRMAYEQRKPSGPLILHTDRGSNYCSKAFYQYLSSVNITHSYSRAHVPYDNSVVETFFASMKREELYRAKYRSETDFMNAVAEYIQFYNEKRPHMKLEYKTPNEKEREFFESIRDSEDFS